MVVNQLFSVVPPFSLFTKILNCFGLENAKDKHGFTIDTMNSLNTIDKLKTIENEIKKYYVPCKVKIFFNQLDHKSAITILRQFARLYGYDIPSKEKFINHRKILIYRVITKIPKERKKKMTLRIDNDSSQHIPVSNSNSGSSNCSSENISSIPQNSNGNISNVNNVNNDANTISQTNVTDTSLTTSSNANNPIIHHNRIEKTSRKIRKKQLMQSYQTNISPSTNDISSGYSSGNNVSGNNNAISDNVNANNKVAQQSAQPTQLTQKINKEYIVNFD
jgi:hypothetical protein